jgi:hypothetical protein
MCPDAQVPTKAPPGGATEWLTASRNFRIASVLALGPSTSATTLNATRPALHKDLAKPTSSSASLQVTSRKKEMIADCRDGSGFCCLSQERPGAHRWKEIFVTPPVLDSQRFTTDDTIINTYLLWSFSGGTGAGIPSIYSSTSCLLQVLSSAVSKSKRHSFNAASP